MRRLLVLLLASLMLLATAACGNDHGSAKADNVDMGQKIDGLSVSGSFGAEPQVKVSSPVQADKPQTQVISKGHGNPVVANKKAMFNIFLAKGSDGKKLWSTYVRRDAFRYESFYASPSTDGARLYTISRSGKVVALSGVHLD